MGVRYPALVVFVALSACFCVGSGHWFGSRYRSWFMHHRLFRDACLSTNTTSGEQKNRTCGCGQDETSLGVTCSLTGLSQTDENGNVIEASFCDIQPVWDSRLPYRGVLRYACSFENVDGSNYTGPASCFRCPEDVTCSLGPISVRFNGTDVRASFCDFQANQEQVFYPPVFAGREDCVPLDCPIGRGSGRLGSGRRPRGRRRG